MPSTLNVECHRVIVDVRGTALSEERVDIIAKPLDDSVCRISREVCANSAGCHSDDRMRSMLEQRGTRFTIFPTTFQDVDLWHHPC